MTVMSSSAVTRSMDRTEPMRSIKFVVPESAPRMGTARSEPQDNPDRGADPGTPDLDAGRS
jgi:hypothetical protein